jgi:very-short-patch-repair endonuclease
MQIIADIAAAQHGVVNRIQCLAAGLGPSAVDRRLRSGELARVLPGVYRLPGAPRTWRQSLMVALLWIGEPAVVSHRAAAALWRIPRFEEEIVEVTGAKNICRISRIVYHRTSAAASVVTIDGLRVTTPARTVVDLASVVSRRVLERALDDLLRRRLVSLESVVDEMGAIGTKGRKGMRTLRNVLRTRFGQGGPSHSEMEKRLFRILVAGGLPAPRKQHQVRRNGRLFAQFDCAYPSLMIAIEADSYRWHGTQTDWDRDRERDRILKLMGWWILRFSWQEVYFHPDYVVAEVRRAVEVVELSVGKRR